MIYMNIGERIFYDQDGEVLARMGEMQGDVLPRKEITSIHFVDLEYGEVNTLNHNIIGIDVDTKKPILELIPREQTPEERIKELEDALLLAADAEMGGIL